MARNSVSRHAVTRLNAYSSQARKLSDSELPMRSVSWAEGLKLVKQEKAVWELSERDGHIKGIRFVEKQRAQNPTPCTLDVDVMKSVAGEGLSGPHTIADVYEGKEETLRNKFKVWALVGDTKAVWVSPRISAEERRIAEKLLGLKAA